MVNGKTATAQIAVKAKAETIVADPNVNLLATFNVIAN